VEGSGSASTAAYPALMPEVSSAPTTGRIEIGCFFKSFSTAGPRLGTTTPGFHPGGGECAWPFLAKETATFSRGLCGDGRQRTPAVRTQFRSHVFLPHHPGTAQPFRGGESRPNLAQVAADRVREFIARRERTSTARQTRLRDASRSWRAVDERWGSRHCEGPDARRPPKRARFHVLEALLRQGSPVA